MSGPLTGCLVGLFALLVLWLGWKLRAFGGASNTRDGNPIAYWITFATLVFGALGSFAFAIRDLIRGS